MPSTITFHLETEDPRRIPATSLRSALDNFTSLLSEVGMEIAQSTKRSISWDITNLQFGSALIELSVSPADQNQDLELADRTIEAAFSGLEIISDGPIRPEHFSDEALESARRLTNLLTDSISRITVTASEGSRHIQITEHLAGNVRQILEHMESYGSVEGILEVLSSRGSLHFSVRNASNGRLVRCNFDEDLVPQAIEAWRKPVAVFGRIRSDNQGHPRTVWVWNLSILRSPDELPSSADVQGISPDMTGGLSSGEYAKSRYDDEHKV